MSGSNDSLVVRIRKKNDSVIYAGQVEKILNLTDTPVLILNNYARYNEQGKIQERKQKSGQFRLAVHFNDIEIFEYAIVKAGANRIIFPDSPVSASTQPPC